MKQNPFKNTKASYFPDDDIVRYWVSPRANQEENVNYLVDPLSPEPFRILGGKGSGKTHLLRYFSFNSQRRQAELNQRTILEQIQLHRFVGIYIVASGLEVSRFSGSAITSEQWNSLFFYYINLELIERILEKILFIFKDNPDELPCDLSEILDNFYNDVRLEKINSLSDLYQTIRNERKLIDKSLSNLRIPNNNTQINIEPLFTEENGFFDIVKSIMDSINALNNIKALFIIDEFENYNETQQKFFNTLIRHLEHPERITLRISGRLNAVKTNGTFDDAEVLLEESEIKTRILEEFMQPSFQKSFANELYQKRLENSDIHQQIALKDILENSKSCNESQLDDLQSTHKNKDRKHITKLVKEIQKYHPDLEEEGHIGDIIENINCDGNWHLEKLNIHLLYKKWSSDLISESENIKTSLENYLSGSSDEVHTNAIDKHGSDMMYQLFRSYGRSMSYSGYDNILKMANSNPRILLTILNFIHKECESHEIDMFNTKAIACKIQDQAIYEASGWFWGHFTDDIEDHRIIWAITKLLELFRMIRRSDKPYEKNLVTFSFPAGETDSTVLKLIEDAKNRSLLIETNQETKNRNSGEYHRSFRLHPMLSPRWDLSISAGGAMPFSKHEIESLFLAEKSSWELIIKEKSKNLNVPFRDSQTISAKKQKELF